MAYRPMGQATGLAGLRGLRGLRGFRGLGQADGGLAPADYTDPGIVANMAAYNPPSNYAIAPPMGAPSTSSGFDWNAAIGGLINRWTSIAGQVIAPQTTVVRGPGGQTYIQTPAGSPTGAASLAATASGIPIWVWALGGLGLVFVFAKGKG